MKRITPEMIVNAYKKTGLKPVRGTAHVGLDKRCCGIGALAVMNGMAYAPYWYTGSIFGDSYISGFAMGFDDMPCPSTGNEELRIGHSDGLACAAVVFGETAP